MYVVLCSAGLMFYYNSFELVCVSGAHIEDKCSSGLSCRMLFRVSRHVNIYVYIYMLYMHRAFSERLACVCVEW